MRDRYRRLAMLRVLHCDDDKTFRFLVRAVLDEEADIELAGEAFDARSCIALTAELQPDVVLLDESMPGMSGLEAIPRIDEACPAASVRKTALRPGTNEAGSAAFFSC